MNDFSISPAVTPSVSSKRRWVVVGLLSLGMIVAYLSRSNISVVLAMPDFVKLFHLSDTDRGTVNSAFFWAYAALQIPAGWLVDRYGVRFPYAFSFVFWCIVSAATAFASSIAHLVTLRILLGAAGSLVTPASIRWIHCNFAERERGLAVGLYMTGTKIGPAVAAPLAAWLTMFYGWRIMSEKHCTTRGRLLRAQRTKSDPSLPFRMTFTVAVILSGAQRSEESAFGCGRKPRRVKW